MGNRYSADHIAKDHIHTDVACNTEEPQQKYRLGTVSNRLLGGGGLIYCLFTNKTGSFVIQCHDNIFQYI